MANAAIKPASPTNTIHLQGRDNTPGTAPLSPTSNASTIPWDATQPDTRLRCENLGIPRDLMAQLQASCNTHTMDIMPYEDFVRLVGDVVACTPIDDIQTEVSRRMKAQTQHRRSQLRSKEWGFSDDPLVWEHAKAPLLCSRTRMDSLYSHWDFIATAEDIIICELRAHKRSRQPRPKRKAPRRSERIRAQRASAKK